MVFTVTIVTTFNEVVELALLECTSRVRQLERQEELVDLLEVRANRVDLVDQILHTHNSVLAQLLLNKLVVRDRNALLVDLSVTTLVDELANTLQVGVTVGNVRVGNRQHLLCGLGQTHKGTSVDLQETEELQDLARLRWDVVDTRLLLISISL